MNILKKLFLCLVFSLINLHVVTEKSTCLIVYDRIINRLKVTPINTNFINGSNKNSFIF